MPHPNPERRDDLPEFDPKRPKPAWRRWLVRLVWLVLLAAVGVFLAAWFALRTDGGRQWLLARVSNAVEAQSGWSLAVHDFSLALRPGHLVLQGVRLGAPGAEPLIVADRAEADFDWGLLRATVMAKDPLVLDKVAVKGLVVDSTAETPSRPEEDRSSSGSFPLTIRAIKVSDAEILGGRTEGWLETWSVRDLSLQGSVSDGGFDATVEQGILRLARRDATPLDLDLSARARGPFEGPYTVQNVDVQGDGLDLEGSGTAGLQNSEPFAADFRLHADAAKLLGTALPSLSPPRGRSAGSAEGSSSGILSGQGSLNFRDMSGSFEIRLDDVPAELFEPLVGSENLDRAAARGTRFNGTAQAAVAFGADVSDAERIRGSAAITWRKDAEPLLDLQVRTRDGAGSGPGSGSGSAPGSGSSPPVRFVADASILPAFQGSPRVEASLRAPSWARLSELRSDIATVDLKVPELAEFRTLLERRWPSSLDTLPPLPWQGRLELNARVTGDLQDPQVDASGRWQPAPGSSVRLTAKGRPMSTRGTAQIITEGFELSSLLPSLQGQLAELTGRLDGKVDVDLRSTDANRVSLAGRLEAAQVSVRRSPDTGEGSDAEASGARPDLVASLLSFEGEASMPWPAAGAGLASPNFVDLVADARLGVRDLELPAGPKLARVDLDAALRDAGLRLRHAEGSVLPPLVTEPEKENPEEQPEDPAVLVSSTEDDAQEADEPEIAPAVRRFGEPMPFEMAGTASFVPDRPWDAPLVREFDLHLTAERPHELVDRAEFDARLVDGTLAVDFLGLDLPQGGPAIEKLTAELPLGGVGRIPGLEDVVAGLPVAQRADGPLRIAFEVPRLDTGEIALWLGQEPRAEQLRASIRSRFEIRPDDPTSSTGVIDVRDVEIDLAEYTFRSAEPQTLSLANRRLRLQRGLWQARNRNFDAEAEVELTSGWTFADPLEEAFGSFSAVATGSLEAALLNGYLAGGRAQGLAEVIVLAAGTPDDNAAEIEIIGDEETTFSWVSPYPTQLTSPTVRLKVEDGVISIAEANARLNEGRLDVEGTVLGQDGQTHLSGFLDSIRYRLDYGLTVLLSGNFDLQLLPESPGELSANILVERGFLRRQVDPDRELVTLLLQPPELDMGDASDLTRSLRLDIDVATVEGVRLKNNVADLHASWAPLEVGGTLDQPFIRGSIEVDPGGKIYAWGQVVRLDRASLEFSGQSDVPARLDLTTTSSLEDPSIATSSDRQLVAEIAEPVPLGSAESEQRFDSQAFASGLTTYYGDQLASRLGSSLSGPRIEYRPLRIFGESSPEAKLVVSQELAPKISLSAAFGLREAEDRIYLVDFHDFDFLPSMSVTAFTTDESDYGATMQQMLRFGGAADVNEDDLPRLDDIVVRCPGCTGPDGEKIVKERKIRRAVGFRTDDLIPDGSDFDVEIDVEEALRSAGFPDPNVKADVDPDSDEGFVDIFLDVELGPRAVFEFEGEVPPRNRRDSIRTLYRVDYYEETAIEEMRVQTERVWKSLGHPEPEVTVRAERLVPDDPRSDRRVTIDSRPGRLLDLGVLEFRLTESISVAGSSTDSEAKLPERAVLALNNRFSTLLWRVKLAVGDEDADARLLRTLTSEGFPQAKIAGRELLDDDEKLVVRLVPGPRRKLDSLAIQGLEIEGLEGAEDARARERLEMSVGDPYVSSDVAREAARLESDLRSRGYYEARVFSEIDIEGDEDLGADVRIIAEPGNRYILHKIEIRGATHTKESWIRDITGLELESPLDRRKVSDARRKLVETRLFSRVTVDANHSPDGTTVVFDLVEKPRFEVAYGGRWESEGGAGAIVEALDHNFTGRGVDLGVRLLYGEAEERARFYSRIPRLFERGMELELFAEVFEDTRDDLQADGWEATGQLKLKIRPRLEGRLYGRFTDQVLTDLTADVPAPERERTPTVGSQLIWDSRDRLLDPTKGLLISLDLSGAREIIAKNDEYLRFYGQINSFVPLTRETGSGRKPWVWSQSFRLGLSETEEEMPRSVRFFAGGPFSVRGYRDKGLGPQEMNDDGSRRARGGQALLILNEELRFPLPWEGVQGVVFADAGNVWFDVGDLSIDDLFTSLGLGVRADTPIGIVRLDFGFPLDARLEDDDYEIYFGFGHAF